MEGNPSDKPKKDIFLIGGKDLEMYQIKKRLSRKGEEFIDKELVWGAKIEDYADVINEILEQGKTPVAVELAGADKKEGVVDIDHHGDKSGNPASISQVMERIDKPMSFVDHLIAANDSAYIPGMQKLLEENRGRFEQRYGKDKFEKFKTKMIDLIRAKDRQMQGVTQEDEAVAEEALKNTETTASGTIVVRISGDKWSAVQDRLFPSFSEGKPNLIIVCDTAKEKQQVYYFGRGDVCKALKGRFESGVSWGGGVGFGQKDGLGFGGAITENPQEVIDFVTGALLQNNEQN
jgi:hypothetical protein